MIGTYISLNMIIMDSLYLHGNENRDENWGGNIQSSKKWMILYLFNINIIGGCKEWVNILNKLIWSLGNGLK
jgi:hypothetical protein